jgi:hypothetical protein
MSQNKDYVEAGKVSEISNGQMKHVEINGKEIVMESSMLLPKDVVI